MRLLRSWGIRPTGVTGHSSGEVSAAFAAGGIDLRGAMAVVYLRGALTTGMQVSGQRRRGGMLAVGLGRKDAEALISELKTGTVVVACVNSPVSVTASGDIEAIEELERRLAKDKVFARKVKAEAAYHSDHMLPIAPDYLASMSKTIAYKGDFNGVIYSSPATGGRMKSAAELVPEHWVKNMLQPVLFDDSLRNLCIDLSQDSKEVKRSVDILVEVGPHSALAGPIRQILQTSDLQQLGIQYGTCLVRGQHAVQTMQNLACNLLSKGYPVDLRAVNFPHGQHELEVIHNLPSYPWNHSVSHWMESKINRAYRQRQHPTHDLLGDLVPSSSPLAPAWRHFIRVSEVPWVQDHLVQSSILYPGAGYICMAIEAASQLSKSQGRPVIGYKLRDIHILNALVVPNTADGIEVFLSFRNCSEDKQLGSQDWQEFYVSSLPRDHTPVVHCKGFIFTAFESTDSPNWSCLPPRPSLKEIASTYTRAMKPTEIYDALHSVGICHGPIFQNLKKIQVGKNQSVSTFSVADTASLMPHGYEHEHVLHPTTLDSLFQAAYSAVPKTQQVQAMIPQSIKSMYVSQTISKHPGHSFQAYTALNRSTSHGFQATILSTSEVDPESSPVLEVNEIHFQSLGDAFAQEAAPATGKLCSTMFWDHGLSMMSVGDLTERMKFSPDTSEIAQIQDLKKLSYLFFHDVLTSLTDTEVRKLSPHHASFYNWMGIQEKLAKLNVLGSQSEDWANISKQERQRLEEQVSTSSINGQMICHLGSKLVAIMRKELAPLELLLEDKLLYKYYEGALRCNRLHLQVNSLVKLFAHQNPRGKILEIGAGTGGCTRSVLEGLGGGETGTTTRFSQYDYTDISTGFFESARERFGSWGNLISYKKLDIESEPADQGFESGTYDLIIACLVLHATKSTDNTLANLRKLLKPGGKLIMVENTQDALDIQLVYGVLPEWWLSMSFI